MRLRKYCCGLSLGRLSATRVGSPTTLAALVFLLTVPASVSSQTPFYQAKTITLVQGTAPGGSSDMMVKAALPYLKKYIPGEPGIVSDYMPGGGGSQSGQSSLQECSARRAYHRKCRRRLGVECFGEPSVLYDINRLIYLGSPHSHYHWVFMSRRKAVGESGKPCVRPLGLESGAQSIGHSVYIVGRLFAYLIGLKEPKFVVGYSGPELDLGLLQGEFDARINNADTLVTGTRNGWPRESSTFMPLWKFPKGSSTITLGVCRKWEQFAKSERERKVLAMLRAFRQVGSPYILPPGTPREQVDILREALVKTFNDPGFHQEYKKLTGDEATPLMPDQMEIAIKELPRDREIVELFKKIAGGGPLPPR